MSQLKAAVIGSPVHHSLSPAMFNAQFAFDGRDWLYEAIEVTQESLSSFINRVRGSEFNAFSVTMPLKEDVLKYVSVVDEAVRVLHATNSVLVVDGELSAYNTDGDGCCDALEEVGGTHFENARAVVFGAGGTARSVSLALLRRGATVNIVNRSRENADRAVDLLKSADSSFDVRVGTNDDLAGARVVVNTTPVGMGADVSHSKAIDGLLQLREGAVVLDAVYQPLDTSFLRAARERGAITVDGLWMLVYQAARQHLRWFGTAASLEVMRNAAERELQRRRK
jgi:shikimate dehydrogenase